MLRRVREGVPLGVLLAIVPAALGVVGSVARSPLSPAEEGPLIRNADALAHGHRLVEPLLPGYSILLAPLTRATDRLETLLVALRFLNVALLALAAVGLFVLMRGMFPQQRREHVALAVVIALIYPAFVVSGAAAISDNVVLPALAWSAVAVHRATVSRSTVVSALTGLLLASLIVVDPATWTIVASGVCALLAVSVVARSRPHAVAVVSTFAGLILAVVLLHRAQPVSGMPIAIGPSGLTARDVMATLASSRVGSVLLAACERFVFMVAATGGTIALGFSVLVRNVRRAERQRVASAMLLANFGLSLVLGAVVAVRGGGGARSAAFEMAAAPLLVAGVAALAGGRVPEWYRRSLPLWLVLVGCVLAGLRIDGSPSFPESGDALLTIVRWLLDGTDLLVLVVLVGAALSALVALAASRSSTAGMATLGAFFVVTTLVSVDQAASDARTRERSLGLLGSIAVAANHDEARCVAFDETDPRTRSYFEHYRMRLRKVDFREWNGPSTGPPPCGAVVSNRVIGPELGAWTAVSAEREVPLWLWVRPEIADSAFDSHLLTGGAGAPISAPSARIVVADARVVGGETRAIAVRVQITNTSKTTFVPPALCPDGCVPVAVGLSWRSPSHPELGLHEPVRVHLPDLLPPGETVEVSGMLPFIVVDFAVTPGDWLLSVDMVQEGVAWWGHAANAQVEVPGIR